MFCSCRSTPEPLRASAKAPVLSSSSIPAYTSAATTATPPSNGKDASNGLGTTVDDKACLQPGITTSDDQSQQTQQNSGTVLKHIASREDVQKFHAMNVVDLADEPVVEEPNGGKMYSRNFRMSQQRMGGSTHALADADDAVNILSLIRMNLPPDPLIFTPFGERRLTYADYTASGRQLKFIEEYIMRVVCPLFANTHTEASATGLQTSHFREEARTIIMESIGADPKLCELVFAGTGSTGAINKLIALLGIKVPSQMKKYMAALSVEETPLVFCSLQEHHSNELMWRETIADVRVIPMDSTGSLNLEMLEEALRIGRDVEKRELMIGTFSAGSNVTGLLSDVGLISSMCHKYGAYACFDYAAAAPYVSINMGINIPGDELSYLDAIFISPHKFVGGPGTPGLLGIRKSFADCTSAHLFPPTIPGGGTVTVVWPGGNGEIFASYEKDLKSREEAGTPGIIEAIRCGLVFHTRALVGTRLIESLEGKYAKRAVDRWRAHGHIWVLGEEFTNITSEHRLSITSFNIRCVPNGKPLLRGDSQQALYLHPHFVSALLNDLYGIQSRSGCSCAAPLGFRLFHYTQEEADQIASLAEKDGIHTKPGWCRINFNYFIQEAEFDFLCSAVEQIATHAWKLLPLYALCLRTGMSWFNGMLDNGTRNFNRKAAVRSLKELELQQDGTVTWKELPKSNADKSVYLKEALKVYDDAPNLVRHALFRFRDLRRKDQPYPAHLETLRRFALGSEILPLLGITKEEIADAKKSVEASNPDMNPSIVDVSLMTNRPRG